MNKKEIEQLIHEYHWRIREVIRLEKILFGSYESPDRSVGVAQYGIEATLPKPNTNLKSHAELKALDARERRLIKRLSDFRDKVMKVEEMAHYLTDDKHLIILDCMMEGLSYRSIAEHLGVSTTKLWQMKNEMIEKIQKEQNEQNEHHQCV